MHSLENYDHSRPLRSYTKQLDTSNWLNRSIIISDMSSSEDPTLLPPPSPNPDEATLPGNPVSGPQPTGLENQQKFGDYELVEEIARGGMGVVYKARQVSLNRTVALKMILSGRFASDSDVRRFYQEAESAANLDHSGIVPIYDIGEHDGHHFFSMKYINGGSLADVLPELRKDPRRLVRLISDVARTVHHAHQRGILHRDLKPANILLDEAGQPLVSDLGLAKQIQSDSNLTHTGAVVGTPAYMPPEQAAATKEITTAADIYSVGAILYEALTGEPPHKAESPMQTLMLVMEGQVTPPREIDRKVHPALELICLKCLEANPEHRYSSAAALADDLDNWLEGKSVSIRPPSFAASLANSITTNLRSAFGAGLIGVVAGLLLSVCLGEGFTSGDFLANSPSRIYAEMKSEIPAGRNFVYIRESEPNDLGALATIGGLLICIGGVGFLVTAVTRPPPGAAPLAMGLVAALMMAITSFAGQLGPMGVGLLMHSSMPRLKKLNDIAVGTSEQSEAAQQALQAEFPVLNEIPVEERANVLAYRIFYDVFLAAPFVIYACFAIVLLFSLPTILATMFSSRVLTESGKLHSVILPYAEFMGFVFALILCLFTFILMNSGQRVFGGAERPPLFAQAITLLALGAIVFALYKRWMLWKWRMGVYLILIAIIIAEIIF